VLRVTAGKEERSWQTPCGGGTVYLVVYQSWAEGRRPHGLRMSQGRMAKDPIFSHLAVVDTENWLKLARWSTDP